jgi:hypothetical protein
VTTCLARGDYLSLDLFLIGNGNQAQPGDPVSGTVFSVADPCTSCILGGSGDWSVFGPEMFVGQVDILGSDPEVNIYMKLVGEGYFDLGNTARLSPGPASGRQFHITVGHLPVGPGCAVASDRLAARHRFVRMGWVYPAPSPESG